MGDVGTKVKEPRMGEAAARLRLETGPIKKVGGRGRTNYIPVEKDLRERERICSC